MSTTQFSREPGQQAMHLTREFDAPADLVLRAHTDPELVVQWLGPRRLTMRIERYDAHDGGRYRYVHTGEDGVEHWFRGVFHGDPSVEGGLRQTFEYEGVPGSVMFETMTFEEHDGRTTIHVTSVFPTVEERDMFASSGAEGGTVESYERLDDVLATMAAVS